MLPKYNYRERTFSFQQVVLGTQNFDQSKTKEPQGTGQTLNPTAPYLVSGAHDGIVLTLRDKNSPTAPAMLSAVHTAFLFWPVLFST